MKRNTYRQNNVKQLKPVLIKCNLVSNFTFSHCRARISIFASTSVDNQPIQPEIQPILTQSSMITVSPKKEISWVRVREFERAEIAQQKYFLFSIVKKQLRQCSKSSIAELACV